MSDSTCTTTFLTEEQQKVFENYLKSTDTRDYFITFSAGVEEGENLCGIIIQANVKRNSKDDEVTSSYILKCSPRTTVTYKMIPLEKAFQREIYLYSKVFCEFEKIQDECNIIDRFKSYPTLYTSLSAPRGDMMVLQNEKFLGFRHQSRFQSLDYEHILFVIKEYARLHALSYAIRYHKPNVFESIVKNSSDCFFTCYDYKGVSTTTQHRIAQALGALHPVKDQLVYEKLFQFSKNSLSILSKLVASRNRYKVISHVDCGISNLLFKYDSTSNVPTQLSILDWQHSRIESPAVDLITFLFSAADTTTRKRYTELILEYYKSMQIFLKELSIDSSEVLPFDVLQNELREYGIVGLTMAFGLIYVYCTVDQKLPNINSDEANELNADGYAFLYDLGDKTQFHTKVREAIYDFYNLGYNFK